MDVRQIPAVVFSDPEIAQAGVSEKEAKEKGLNVNVSKVSLYGCRSLSYNQ